MCIETFWMRAKGVVTNYGEGEGGGGKSSFTPTKGGRGGRKSCSYAGGGVTNSFEVVLTQELEVLGMLIGGGRKKGPPFKRCVGGVS